MSQDIGHVRYLTVEEVAAVMRVSKMTVYRLLHSGDLPGIRVGRSFRVPQHALDAYLRSSSTVPAELGSDISEDADEQGRLSS